MAEELAFRGNLMRWIAASDFESAAWHRMPFASIAISSALFGVMHGQRWAGGAIAGAAFALVAIRHQRIGEGVASHAVANAPIAACVLGFGHWELW